MAERHNPILHTVKVKELRPTQMTVGLHEVALKRKQLRAMSSHGKGSFLGKHFLPAVLGPKGRFYIVDHHDLGFALLQEDIDNVYVNLVGDLSHLEKPHFLTVMDNRSWLHPFDGEGKRQAYDALPGKLKDLADDPYRSLAGSVRRGGGYAKNATPFSEFLWADFFRRYIDPDLVAKNYDKAARMALALAKRKAANYLPGWCGIDEEEQDK